MTPKKMRKRKGRVERQWQKGTLRDQIVLGRSERLPPARVGIEYCLPALQ